MNVHVWWPWILTENFYQISFQGYSQQFNLTSPEVISEDFGEFHHYKTLNYKTCGESVPTENGEFRTHRCVVQVFNSHAFCGLFLLNKTYDIKARQDTFTVIHHLIILNILYNCHQIIIKFHIIYFICEIKTINMMSSHLLPPHQQDINSYRWCIDSSI